MGWKKLSHPSVFLISCQGCLTCSLKNSEDGNSPNRLICFFMIFPNIFFSFFFCLSFKPIKQSHENVILFLFTAFFYNWRFLSCLLSVVWLFFSILGGTIPFSSAFSHVLCFLWLCLYLVFCPEPLHLADFFPEAWCPALDNYCWT